MEDSPWTGCRCLPLAESSSQHHVFHKSHCSYLLSREWQTVHREGRDHQALLPPPPETYLNNVNSYKNLDGSVPWNALGDPGLCSSFLSGVDIEGALQKTFFKEQLDTNGNISERIGATSFTCQLENQSHFPMQTTDTLCPWGQSFPKVQSSPHGPGSPCLQYRLQAVIPLPVSDLSTSGHSGLPKTEDTEDFLETATASVVDISESSRAPGWEDDASFK